MITVGIPDDKFPPAKAFDFAANGAVFGASHIGSKKEAMEMLRFVAEKNIKPWYVYIYFGLELLLKKQIGSRSCL